MRALAIMAAIIFVIGFRIYLMTPGQRRFVLLALIASTILAFVFAYLTSQKHPTYQGGPFCRVDSGEAVFECEYKLRSAESLRHEATS